MHTNVCLIGRAVGSIDRQGLWRGRSLAYPTLARLRELAEKSLARRRDLTVTPISVIIEILRYKISLHDLTFSVTVVSIYAEFIAASNCIV